MDDRVFLTPGRMGVEDLREDGKLLAFAWPSGVPIVYIMATGEVLCSKCADEARAEPVNWFVYHTDGSTMRYEIDTDQCGSCGAKFESGDPGSGPN
jgi:hypothetical protein